MLWGRASRRGLHAWRERVRRGGHEKCAASTARHRALLAAVISWAATARRERAHAHLCAGAVCRMLRCSLTRAIHRWAEWRRWRLCGAAPGLRLPTRRSALRIWRGSAVRSAQQTRLLCLHATRRRVRARTAAFGLWGAIASRERRLAIAGSARSEWKRRRLRHAHGRWGEGARRRRLLARATVRMLRASAARAVRGWCRRMERRRRHLAFEGLAFRCFRHQNLPRAVRAWTVTARHRVLRSSVRHALGNRSLRRSLGCWMVAARAVSRGGRQVLQAGMVWRRTRALGAWLHWRCVASREGALLERLQMAHGGGLRCALSCWRVRAELASRADALLLASSRAYYHSQALAAFDAWLLHVKSCFRLRRIPFPHRALRRALISWQAANTLSLLQQRRCRRALSALCHAAFSRTFDQWVGWMRRAQDHQAKMARSVFALFQQAARRALHSLGQLRAHRLRGLTLQLHSERFFFKRRSLGALGAWQRSVQRRATRVRLRQRAVRSLSLHRLRRGLLHWCARLKGVRRIVKLSCEAATAAHLNGLWRAYNSWAGLVMHAAKLQVLSRSWRNPVLKQAFATWRKAPPHHLSIALQAWLRRPVMRTFCAWRDRAEGTAIKLRAAGHLLHRVQGLAMNQWSSYSRLMCLVRLVAATCRANGLRTGLLTWSSYAEARGTSTGLTQESLHHWQGCELHRAYGAWAALLDRPAGFMTTATYHLRHRQTATAFSSWEHRAGETKGMAAALARYRSNATAHALSRWTRWLDARAQMEHATSAGRLHVSHLPLARMLLTWRQIVREKKRMRGVLRAMLMPKSLCKALHAWQEYSFARREKLRVAQLVLFAFQPLGTVFRHWHVLGRVKTRQRRGVARCQVARVVSVLSRWDARTRLHVKASRGARFLLAS